MTSATFTLLPISSISFDDSQRQRGELRGVEELMNSIREIGLINPPLVTRDGTLIAGRRRLEAMLRLGWLEVPIQYADEVEPDRLHLIELEENVKRVDLSWQETVRAVTDYHALRQRERPEWTQRDTAKALSMSESVVGDYLNIASMNTVAPELKIMNADIISTAKGLATRAAERRGTTAMEELLGGTSLKATLPPRSTEGMTAEEIAAEPVPRPRIAEILNVNFLDWLKTNEERFNFIHCDFPYGVDTGSKNTGQSATKRLGSYDDSEGVYWSLLETLCQHSKRICEPQAHLMFWLSMRFYAETKRNLEQAGWKIDPFPLVWGKSDNSGIIPDSNRGPRRGYEVALFGSRGDRKVVRPVSNFIACSNPRENHAHEKPQEALQHFMRMFVDGSTTMLDPTCGSGSAVKAAEVSGARRALGLELNAEFAERARKFVGA